MLNKPKHESFQKFSSYKPFKYVDSIVFFTFRSFGVHMSKVRSITLDAWDPELFKVMSELGNDVVNRIYEANLNDSIAVKATPECSR